LNIDSICRGDVGQLSILDTLRGIAPVVAAVRGNIDRGYEFDVLPERATVKIDGLRICVLHDLAQFDEDAAAEGYSAVITGHSHVPKIETRHGVLFLNPGSAGPRRFKLPIALGRLTIESGRARGEIVTLAP